MSFRELGLAEPLLRAVAAEGYADANSDPIGVRFPTLLAGRDLLGTAQTGTGKTAAFALPILHRLLTTPPRQSTRAPDNPRPRALADPRAGLLKLPTAFRRTVAKRRCGTRRSLAESDKDRKSAPFATASTFSSRRPAGCSISWNRDSSTSNASRSWSSTKPIACSTWAFFPMSAASFSHLPAERQTILLSATMPQPIAALANSLLDNPTRIRIAPVAATTKLIEQSVCFVEARHKPRVLTRFFKTRSIDRALVFTRTKRGADRVVRDLAKSGIRATAIHGNKSQSNRQRALANFKSRHTPILIATDIAARGIDVEGISHVLNYDLPHEPETYVHRIGRTGRAGASGIAVSFCDDAERKLLKAIERLTRTALAVEKSVSIDAARQRVRTGGSPESSQRACSRESLQRRQAEADGSTSAAPRSPRPGEATLPRKSATQRRTREKSLAIGPLIGNL